MANRPRILIVEDNPADVRLILEAFRERGIEPDYEHIETAQAAIRRVNAIRSGAMDFPDLLLLDYNLPGGTASDVLLAIGANPDLAGVPKAVLTCSVAPKDKEQALATGANIFIYKPADLDEFLNNVGKALADSLSLPAGSP